MRKQTELFDDRLSEVDGRPGVSPSASASGPAAIADGPHASGTSPVSPGLPARGLYDFLGAGWAFPPRLDARGRIALSVHDRDIEEAVLLILQTRPGERPMRPEFGSQLHRLAFQPNNAATAGLARRYVIEALTRWEPRIDEIEVNAAADPDRPEVLRIEIAYRIPATNDLRNLVFPFYTISGEE